jgi:hypothetical protein
MNRAFVAGSNGPPADRLRYADKDARDIARCLSAPRCGFEVETPEAGTSVGGIRDRLYAAADRCRPGDTFVCYFSGHGRTEAGSLFLLWDMTDFEHLLPTTLSATTIVEAMRHCRADNKLLILDCCQAGAVVGDDGFRDGDAPSSKDVVSAENHLVLMAADRFQRARELDELGGGFLTQNLCRALTDGFVDAAGADRRLSIGDTQRWLEQQAGRHNAAYPGRTVPTPYLFGQQLGEFFFTAAREDWMPRFLEVAGREFVVVPYQVSDGDHAWILLLGRYLVTNAEYRQYVADTGADRPMGQRFDEQRWVDGFRPWGAPGFDAPDQPVVCLPFKDARRYCEWLSRTNKDVWKRPSSFLLPTAAEWDVAAFGTVHPSRDPSTWLTSSPTIHQHEDRPAAIDTTGRRDNRLGLSDMIGNVWEWCASSIVQIPTISWIERYEYTDGPAALRGGGYLDHLDRVHPFMNEWEIPDGRDVQHSDVGFRVGMRAALDDLPDDLEEAILAFDTQVKTESGPDLPITA